MRHGKKFNHLGRTSAHRKALLRNQAISLIMHKRIKTTVAKAKALRRFIEPLITKAKDSSMHSHRVVFSYLQNKEAVKELFGPVIAKVGDCHPHGLSERRWSRNGADRTGGLQRGGKKKAGQTPAPAAPAPTSSEEEE